MAEIVAIGTSWGGLHALSTIVAGLPASFPVPIVVVQHRSRDAEALLRELLQQHAALEVCEVEDKQPLVTGHVFVAPANYHLLVDRGFCSLVTDPPVRYSRPSIDVMLYSAADAYRAGAVGVVLTGANEDGAAGLRRIVDRGGHALVQDPQTAESPVMPRAARKAVPEAEVVPLEEIAPRLARLAAPSGVVGARRGR